MSNSLCIDGCHIGPNFPPYVIAEMSANHNGSLDAAKEIIRQARLAGASAIKIQTYRPDTITLKCDKPDFQITHGLWAGKSLYDLYDWAHTPWEWHRELFDFARQQAITLFSSPFDHTAVDLLEDLNAPAYKIASFEAIDLPLIRYVAATGKPMIISTGMANAEEIAEAVDAARSAGCEQLALLHCVSAYPAKPEDYNLQTLADMAERFGTVTGLSDHTLGLETAIASIALGGSIIEKHFTLDRQGGGPDDSFSLEPEDLAQLTRSAGIVWASLGQVDYHRQPAEQENLIFRRSLYFVKDLPAGHTLTLDDIRSVRPGFGLAPKYLDQLVGRRLGKAVTFGTAVSWEAIE